MKYLLLICVVLCVSATPSWQRNYDNYVFLPQNYGSGGHHQNYRRQNYQQQSRAPTVEIQQVTAEWVCNNYVTGEVKFFGVRDVVTTRLSSADVEQLLKQGVPNVNPNTNPNINTNANTNANANANANVNVNPQRPVTFNENNPFLRPDPVPQTEPPNTDGVGIIEARIG